MQVCQQIRTEFRPIFLLHAIITVHWNFLGKYFDYLHYQDESYSFYSTKVIIYMDEVNYHSQEVYREGVDILPLIEMRLQNKDFECQFTHDPTLNWQQSGDNDYRLASVEDACSCLNFLVGFSCEKWNEKIRSGVFEELSIRLRECAFMSEFTDLFIRVKLGHGGGSMVVLRAADWEDLLSEGSESQYGFPALDFQEVGNEKLGDDFGAVLYELYSNS